MTRSFNNEMLVILFYQISSFSLNMRRQKFLRRTNNKRDNMRKNYQLIVFIILFVIPKDTFLSSNAQLFRARQYLIVQVRWIIWIVGNFSYLLRNFVRNRQFNEQNVEQHFNKLFLFDEEVSRDPPLLLGLCCNNSTHVISRPMKFWQMGFKDTLRLKYYLHKLIYQVFPHRILVSFTQFAFL